MPFIFLSKKETPLLLNHLKFGMVIYMVANFCLILTFLSKLPFEINVTLSAGNSSISIVTTNVLVDKNKKGTRKKI